MDAPQPLRGIEGTEEVALDAIRLDPHNLRLHNPRNLKTIAASLTRWGQQKPLVVDLDGVIRAGNGTYLAAKALGWERIWIARTRLTGQEAKAYAIADNRSGELSEFDTEGLIEAFGASTPALLEALGFDRPELDEMTGTEDEVSDGRDGLDRQTGKAVTVVLPVEDVASVERALQATHEMNRGKALMVLCESYLAARQLDPIT